MLPKTQPVSISKIILYCVYLMIIIPIVVAVVMSGLGLGAKLLWLAFQYGWTSI